jgi:1-deoxy-D-xylulose-5-phosphate synthase
VTVLERIGSPADVRDLCQDEVDELAREIRAFLVSTLARTGGHLGPNLGVVELTSALHRVFESPQDRIIYDTGHQTYVHKLLTGRAARFGTLRQRGGISGYPNRGESVHDLIENSHASAALSYADGLAKGHALREQESRAVVAVVGDGSLTGGMAWEALNNIGAAPDRPVVIVLNDNGRSYCPTVGGLAGYLSDLRAGTRSRPTIFDGMGIAYVGPVDGHDVPALERQLRRARAMRRPVLVHCVTVKGRGYPPAECDGQDHLHSPGPFDLATGIPWGQSGQSWTAVFAEELLSLASERADLVAITAAMLHPTGLARLAERYPNRVFDVGISEQHAVTSAAGLALAGLHPVVAIYSTFLNRALDQVLMDVALHALPVTFVLDRAGITGDDGASHNGMWDLSLLQAVPSLRIAAPRDGRRLRALLREAVATGDVPTALRFPKGSAAADIPAVACLGAMDVLFRHSCPDVLLIACGALAGSSVTAAQLLAARGIGVTVVDPRWVKPLDRALGPAAAGYRLVVVAGDNGHVGGVGDAVARMLRRRGVHAPVLTLGLPQQFLPHGSRAELLADAGLGPDQIAQRIADGLAGRVPGPVIEEDHDLYRREPEREYQLRT